MRLLLEVFFFSFKDIVYIGLRVEIDQRKPGALNLDLQFMPFLKGVNDSLGALEELFAKLADASVLPYYLHQLDRVAGAAHFEVPIETGKQLIKQLRTKLPGYAVPRYVQEIPKELAKTILA